MCSTERGGGGGGWGLYSPLLRHNRPVMGGHTNEMRLGFHFESIYPHVITSKEDQPRLLFDLSNTRNYLLPPPI